MYHNLRTYINGLQQDAALIPSQRKAVLEEISGYAGDCMGRGQKAKLIYICTHNSRRSHLCQIWTAALARHVGLSNVESYSGGTEATAFNSNAVAALRRAGFKVENPGGKNPRYGVYTDDDDAPLSCFSKTFDDAYNPRENFAAIMTCTDAEENCPFLPGALARYSLPYEDPKKADGTPQQEQVYDRRCRQIASEMHYMLSLLAD